MKFVIVGKGHLGSYIVKKLEEAGHGVYHHGIEMDILTTEVLVSAKPDYVVNTAGKTDLKWCEENPLETFRCNVIAPVMLRRRVKEAAEKLDKKIGFIQISSGCVWDGPYDAKGQPFNPQSDITPACYYSWTKALCDSQLLVEKFNTDNYPQFYKKDNVPILIIRPRQVYSPVKSPRNTLEKMKIYANLLDTPNSMTSADTIVKTITRFCEETWTQGYWDRIVNCYDKGFSSPYEVAKYLHLAGLRAEPGLLDKSKLDGWHKPKRVDTVLEDKIFENVVLPPIVQQELQRVIGEYARA
jgi:dTDP-4-dehydrorhamnose reductase